MNATSLAQAFTAIVAAAGSLLGISNRAQRRRADIRANLELLAEIEKSEIVREGTPAQNWLASRIALDVAQLAGVRLGSRKRPIQWGSVVLVGVLALGLGVWTASLNLGGFRLISLLPGVFATLFLLSFLGQFVNREIPDEEPAEADRGQEARSTTPPRRDLSGTVNARGRADGDLPDTGRPS